MGTWIFLCVPWCVRVLNWDCADSDEEREGNGLGRHGLFPLLLLNGLMSLLGSGGSIICFV